VLSSLSDLREKIRNVTDPKKVAHRLMGIRERCDQCFFWKIADAEWDSSGFCKRHDFRRADWMICESFEPKVEENPGHD